MDAADGRLIGGYRIVQSIKCGAGSQGTVYRAVCEAEGCLVPPGTPVALKVMPVQQDDPRLERMKSRTDALSAISHPNIVRYFGGFVHSDSFSDSYVVVQEFLEGETLKSMLSRFPCGLDVDTGVRIADSVMSALGCAASHGIVHRDVKPANVFVCSDGTVKMIDFEVARAAADATVSSAGNLHGSFDYMAPELTSPSFRGDERSDVFSVGVVLHEMLSGRLPYRTAAPGGDASFEFVSRWSSGTSPVRLSPKIPVLLKGADAVIAKALSADPSARHSGFAECRAALSRVRMKMLRNGASTYQMLQLIGKGGFGEVYKARVRETRRLVAVKRLLKEEYAERFCREARIMSRLDNPCFVRFVDFFFTAAGADGRREAFLVMDFLEGMPGNSLRDAIKGAKGAGLEPAAVLLAFARYARGLALMHAHGIYHRDIKPANLYFPKGSPEKSAIMDLGIARDVHGTVTTGQVPGTLDYMPPEVVVAGSRGESGMDIYALGLCLYEAISGKTAYPRLPGGSSAYFAFFSRAKDKTPPDLEAVRGAFGGELHSLLREMTQPDVAKRLKDAGAVADRLERMSTSMGGACAPPPPRTRMPPPPPAVRRPAETQRPAPRSIPTQRSAPAQRSVPDIRRVQRSAPVRAPARRREPVRVPKWLFPVLGAAVLPPALFFGVFALFGRPLNRFWAEWELGGVIDSWSRDNEAKAQGMESRWLSRWNPVRYGWRRIESGDFAALTNRLEAAKAEIRRNVADLELRLARDAERKTCMDRLSACRRLDGSLDAEKYMALDGWALPGWLEGDREVAMRLSGLDHSLSAAIKAKLALEPAATRNSRIREASALLRNSWTGRLLAKSAVEKLGAAIDAVSVWCVVTVRNACSDVIRVDGTEIAVGGSRAMTFKDGRSDRRSVECEGYRPMNLPPGLDGKVFEVSDAMLAPLPVQVKIPLFEEGVLCRIGDVVCRPSGTVELVPGDYTCVYSKSGFADQRIPFTVHVNVRPLVPEPVPWERTEEYQGQRNRIDRGRQHLLTAPVEVSVPRLDVGVACLVDGVRQGWGTVKLIPGEHRFRYERDGFEPQGGKFEVRPGEPVRLNPPGRWETVAEAAERRRVENLRAMQDAVRKKCAGLWANEPVEDRQDRLEAAGVSVSKAIYDGILTEGEAEPLLDEINRRKKWAVGKVKNGCSVPIAVGGQRVDAGTTKLIVFEAGIPDEWFLDAEGFERKPLLRDFDGCVLSFDSLDLVPLDVEVSVPPLGFGVTCHFEGAVVSNTIRLKPGRYSCIYRKRGYKDQTVRFEVRPSRPMTLPQPSAWKAK